MLYFRACPRCRTGTVEHSDDAYGNYLQCLNCGFMRDLPDEVGMFTGKRQTEAEAEMEQADEYETAEEEEADAVA